jgi:hypothetical protein
LDIERAFNKLEKVALTRRRSGSSPLILIINSTHLVRDDHDGQDLLEMIQQRAEQWAASGLVTTSKSQQVLHFNLSNSRRFQSSTAMIIGFMSA